MLKELLKQNRYFSPVYGRSKLANHMSMSLIALNKMGANERQLQSFYDKNQTQLVALPPIAIDMDITEENWQDFLGQSNYFQPYILFFKKSILQSNVVITLRKYLAVLIKGISSQGFHCLIRLAYSIEINDADEIATSLAYFSSEYTELRGIIHVINSTIDSNSVLDKIRSGNFSRIKEDQNNTIVDRLLNVVAYPDFDAINDDISVMNVDLPKYASIVIRIYASTKNFTALHMVTATHALRIITPYLINYDEALRLYWQAISAAYIAIGKPLIAGINDLALSCNRFTNWNDIFKQAISFTDDHVIKFVYTCYEEDKAYPNPIYKTLAEMAAKT